MIFIVKEYITIDESALKTMVGYKGHRKPFLNRFNIREHLYENIKRFYRGA